jgi:hypothetical protein
MMRPDDLTKAQCAAIRNKFSKQLAYLYPLNRRMGEKGHSRSLSPAR